MSVGHNLKVGENANTVFFVQIFKYYKATGMSYKTSNCIAKTKTLQPRNFIQNSIRITES